MLDRPSQPWQGNALPSDECLLETLRDILRPHLASLDRMVLVGREPNSYFSSFPTEILTIQTAGHGALRLFAKYEGRGPDERNCGHRGGLARERCAYERVLARLGRRPRYFGAHEVEGGGGTWLFVEYLENAMRFTRVPKKNHLPKVGAWLGRFHAETASLLEQLPVSRLPRYDEGYFAGWARRVEEYAVRFGQQARWLQEAISWYRHHVGLLARPKVVIHGEFYPKNVLIHDDHTRVVDWESAAVAVGEIDLATLLEGWPPNLRRECESAYWHARMGVAADCVETLRAAEIYSTLRWAGWPTGMDEARFGLWVRRLRTVVRRHGMAC